MKYRPEIDGLRAIAVIPVVLFHAEISLFSGGYVGVDIFFVISGFLITSILLAEVEQDNFSLVHFYERRARRILPALFFIVILCMPFAWYWMLPSELLNFSQSLIAVTLFVSNYLFSNDVGYFAAAAETKPLLHTWSLAVEEQYYLTFPVFLAFAWRFGKSNVFWMIVATAALSFALSEWAWRNKPEENFFFGPTRAWELYTGSIAAFIAQKNIKPSNVLSILGLTAILYSIFFFDSNTPFPSAYTLAPVIGTLLLIIFTNEDTLVGKLLSGRVFVGIGLISFSVYLWHQPIFAFARMSTEQTVTPATMLLLSALSVILAIFSWRYVEQPFRVHKGFKRSQIFTLSLIAGVGIIAVGLFGIYKNGDLGRWPKSVINFEIVKAEANEFVWRSKNARQNAKFDPAKIKVLIVGDSNSADFQNMLDASNQANNLSIISQRIDAGCGNLYLPRSEILSLVEERKKQVCGAFISPLSTETKQLYETADIVIFASKWKTWEASLIQKSHKTLEENYGPKFWYFGTKQTNFKPFIYIQDNGDLNWPDKVSPTAEGLKINALLEKQIGSQFINPYKYFCHENACDVVRENGEIIQYDGFHLTKAGAAYLAGEFEEVFLAMIEGTKSN